MLNIGDTVYVFDSSRRVYARDASGKPFGAPLYREHFRPTTIIGETSRSWIIRFWDKKIPKSTLVGIFTLAQIDDEVWKHEHRSHILRLVEQCSAEQLRAIATIVGYEPN